MVGERGPQGAVHVPAYSDGCYYSRARDCCWLCLCRLVFLSVTSPIRRRIDAARTDTEHELVGERIFVPDVSRSTDGETLEYRRGRVSGVHVLDDEASLVTVTLDSGGVVHLDTSLADRDVDSEGGATVPDAPRRFAESTNG